MKQLLNEELEFVVGGSLGPASSVAGSAAGTMGAGVAAAAAAGAAASPAAPTRPRVPASPWGSRGTPSPPGMLWESFGGVTMEDGSIKPSGRWVTPKFP